MEWWGCRKQSNALC